MLELLAGHDAMWTTIGVVCAVVLFGKIALDLYREHRT